MTKLTILRIICVYFFLSILTWSGNAQTKIDFSHERGFYYNSFQLIITPNTAYCTIKYTLDGSNPLSSINAHSTNSPVTLEISPYLSPGRAITPGVIIRACAIGSSDTSDIETHSYIFPDEVKFQSEVSPQLAPYWPTEARVPCTYPDNILNWMRSDFQTMDFGVDPQVVHNSDYYSMFEKALLVIPTFSLVTDPSNLFDTAIGIYTNSTWSGREWERAGSIELLNSSDENVQANTGIRIRGGFSAIGYFAKHAFRLFFRDEYGNGKFKHPLFGDKGAGEFDKIDLRCSQNNSWHIGNSNANFIHDLFAREIQRDMGQPYTQSEYYHLYVNGKYWGLYQTQERAEARYAESYLGGKKEDYDVVKSSGPSYDYPPYTLEATDGDLNSSRTLWEIASEGFTAANYNKAKGLNPDGTPNTEFPILLDEENLIDYIIINYYVANTDGPIVMDGSTRINNFFGIYNRENPEGFQYFMHDTENAFSSWKADITNREITVGEEFSTFNPMWLHYQLLQNEDYEQKFADRAYKHLLRDGALTVENNLQRFGYRVNQIDQAIIGESARWGDAASAKPFTKLDTWDRAIKNFNENFITHRTDAVIEQFQKAGWFNGIIPPELNPLDFDTEESITLLNETSFSLINLNSTGDIYYTLHNTDPRENGGAISSEAIKYIDKISASSTVFLKARVKDGNNWSPIFEYVVLTSIGSGLIISELNYNPKEQILGPDTLKSKNLEYIELKNNSGKDLDISGFSIDGGITYHFPLNTIVEKDSLIVLVADSASFRKLYGFEGFGVFQGDLNNAGEIITLNNAGSYTIASAAYNNEEVWYKASDGSGFTLVYSDYKTFQNGTSKSDWRVSTNWLGSPGKDDPTANLIDIQITEVLANSEQPFRDAIELFNPGNTDVNIGNWFLSDERDTPAKWRIQEGTIIPAGKYLVFYEGHYVADSLQYDANEFGSAFSISSAGENLYLFSGDASENVLNFISSYKVGASETNTSFGNFISVSGDTHTVQLADHCLGEINLNAKQSPVIFKSIMYNPIGNNVEYLILKNRSDSLVKLYSQSDSAITWKVDGIGFRFPKKTSLPAGDSLYLIENKLPEAQFKSLMNIPDKIQVYNYPGKLKNSSEDISILCPIEVIRDTIMEYAWVNLETVEYTDDAPWPLIADGDGYALQRIDEEDFANDAANWRAIQNILPDADAGENKRVRLGAGISLDGSGNSNLDNEALTYEWNLISKPEDSKSNLSENTNKTPEFTPDEEGEYVFSLQVDNGSNKSALSYMAVFAHENHQPLASINPAFINATALEPVEFSAKGCYDPDYDILNYFWTITEQPEGSTATIENDSEKTIEFVPDMPGTFRIELIADDGHLYSNPAKARIKVSASSSLTLGTLSERMLIYPNPVKSDINIDFNLQTVSDILVSFSTLEGKTVYSRKYELLESGEQHLNISLSKLDIAEGIYLISVHTSDFSTVKKIIYMPYK